MAGGVGSRFWPISREARPKQFLRFSESGKSFLRLAYERALGIVQKDNVYVVSLTRYRSLVASDIPELDETNMLLEPYNRSTAPCITYAMYAILKRDPHAVIAVFPADHVIDDTELYCSNVRGAMEYASDHECLITLGVVPTRPDSNFGYIQVDGEIVPDTPMKVKTFTEKPDKELARVFLESGEFLWNSGIFVSKARFLDEQLRRYAPEVTRPWQGWESMLGTDDEMDFVQRLYPDMPRISIDYAVLEKSDSVITYPSHFGWADVGNWESFYEYLVRHDENGNAVKTRGKKFVEECTGTIVYSRRKDKLVAVNGMKDFIVIDTEDVLMICPRDEEKLKKFLSELAMPDYKEYR